MSEIAKCLENLGYKGLTNLQKKSFETITKTDKSLVIIAPTGSGKTEAAIFPLMYMIRKHNWKPVSVIYISPLRALNRDLEERLKRIGKCFNVTVDLRHGDTPSSKRKKIVSKPPDILITTPETLNYLVIDDEFKKHLLNVKFIIMDEFRELIESKRGYLLFTVIYLLEKYFLKKRVRKIALTATLRNIELASRVLESNPSNVIVLSDESLKKMEVKTIVPKPSGDDKAFKDVVSDPFLAASLKYIIDIVKENKSVLIFTNTRSLAERLGYLLSSIVELLGENIVFGVHHGSLSKQHRLTMEQGFKNGVINGLIATSSMELGIDIGRVNYVVQYNSPRQATRLIQRVGRSGHRLSGVAKGSVIVSENLYQILESTVLTRRALNYDIEVEKIEDSPLDVLSYTVALLTLLNNGVDKYELYNWLTNYILYSNLDIDIYSKLIEYLVQTGIVKIQDNVLKPTRKTRIYVYKVTMIPDTRNIDVVSIIDNKTIGVLNEEYVVSNVKPGDILVLAGNIWRVVNYDDENGKLYVENAVIEQEIVIPHWEGENIPVEYRVAREVGSVVRRLKNGVNLKEYDLPWDVIDNYTSHIHLFGDDKTIIVEYNEELNAIFINLHGGSKVNRFTRDLLKALISDRYPFIPLEYYFTPYAIILAFRTKIRYDVVSEIIDLIVKTLSDLENYLDRDRLLSIASKHSTLYWRIYQVAQRFGAIDPENTHVSLNILKSYVDTIIGYEAFKEVLFKDYDLESVKELSNMIKKGVIKIVKRINGKASVFNYELLSYIEIPSVEFKPFKPEIYREKILNRKTALICLRCGYLINGRLRDLLGKNNYSCPQCKSLAITVVKGDGLKEREIVLRNIKGVKISGEEKKILEDLRRRSLLLRNHGEIALIALTAPGVGVNDVASIVNRVESGEDLFRVLYDYEKRAIRAMQFIRSKDKSTGS